MWGYYFPCAVFLGDRMGYGSHLAEAGTITRRDSKCRTFEYSKEPPLLSTSFFWVWAAPSTTLTLSSLSRNWIMILKELRSLPPNSMCTLWTLLLNLSIPDVPFFFPVLLSTLIRSRFKARPATLLIPTGFSFSQWRSFTVLAIRYQSGSVSLINVGSGSHTGSSSLCQI